MALLVLAVLGVGELFATLPSAFVDLGRVRTAARRVSTEIGRTTAVAPPARPAPGAGGR
ncbi:MAG: hypothetical protein U5L11_04110 [Arhodomonas sp.]|nr:hypothetical protein [Arhodomonas sp.]